MLDAENEKLWALRGERAASTQLSVPVSEFESREPQWLIEKLIPLNVPTLLCGDGGCGKSTLTLNIAAAISRGDIYGAVVLIHDSSWCYSSQKVFLA